MDDGVVGPLQGSGRGRRCLWDAVGCGRRLGFDPKEVHRREPLSLSSPVSGLDLAQHPLQTSQA